MDRNKQIIANFHIPLHYRKKPIVGEVFTIYNFYRKDVSIESHKRVMKIEISGYD